MDILFTLNSSQTNDARPHRRGAAPGLVILLVGCLFLSSGCARMARYFADREVYRIIDAASIDGMPEAFTIEQDEDLAFFQDPTSDTLLLTLSEALEIAVHNSREYQTQKEALFSQGLALSLARHQWSPLMSGMATLGLERTVAQEARIDPETGGTMVDETTGEPLTRTVRPERLSSVLSLGVRQMLWTGADLSADILMDFNRFIHTHDPSQMTMITMRANIVQPLLKGFGVAVAMESIRQAERDMIYAIRNFVQYRKRFSVQVAKTYYDLIRAKDQLANSESSYRSRVLDQERSEALLEAGLNSPLDTDRFRQSTLTAWDQWISAQQAYESALDQFKLTLGISTIARIDIDDTEKDRLMADAIATIDLELDDAVEQALMERLDLKTTMDRQIDAERKIKVAENGLLMQVDISGGYTAQSLDPDRPFRFTQEGTTEHYAVDVELPLDKKAERNIYRQSLIDLEASRRDTQERIDSVILEVREAFRSLEQARQSYEIQLNSLRLAERRVESTEMFEDAGRGEPRDTLEAKDALLAAQNAVTAALVNHRKARLDLFLAMEALVIDDNGLWQTNLRAGEDLGAGDDVFGDGLAGGSVMDTGDPLQ